MVPPFLVYGLTLEMAEANSSLNLLGVPVVFDEPHGTELAGSPEPKMPLRPSQAISIG